MSRHLPAIQFLLPLVTAICLPVIGLKHKEWSRPLTHLTLLLMTVVSVVNLVNVMLTGPIEYAFGGWAPPVGIEWVADGLASVLMVPLSILSWVCVIYMRNTLSIPDLGNRVVHFYILILLLIAGLTGMVYAGDLFNLFVFLEVVALCGYALVGVAGGKALVSAFRYLILGTFGASLYLLGVSFLYAETGTLNMGDLAERLPGVMTSKAVAVGVLFMFIGLGIKMALIPLHGWLPDAYTHSPESVTPFLASLVTKVALYGWIRIMFWVLGANAIVYKIPVLQLVGFLGGVAAVVGAFLALSQEEVKRMFAFGGLSHIGLILVGISLGNQTGFAGGVFYLLNDAVMQAGLFFFAGIAIHRFGVQTVEDLIRLGGRPSWMVGSLIVMAMAMIGIPPTGGFFGKWYMILGAIQGGNYLAVAAILGATLLTMAYFIKLFERVFRERGAMTNLPVVEVSSSLKGSLIGMSVAIIILGIFSDAVVGFLIDSTIPPGLEQNVGALLKETTTSWNLAAL